MKHGIPCCLVLLALSLVGCSGRPAAPTGLRDPKLDATAEVEPRTGARPGFVLYTRDQTIALPLDGSEPISAAGIVVVDMLGQSPVVARLSTTEELPPCPCAIVEGSCEEDERFVARLGTDGECRCRVVAQPSRSADDEYDDDDDHDDLCDEEDLSIEPVSLFGGQLYEYGSWWNGACSGLNIYDAVAYTHELVDGLREIDDSDAQTLACSSSVSFGGDVPAPWPIDFEQFGCSIDGPHDDDDDDCWVCHDMAEEAEVFLLRRGQIWRVRDNVSGVGGGRWIAAMPARPTLCPSVHDPCGDPRAFAGLIDLEANPEFWIANSGAAALTANGHAYTLWRLAEAAPVHVELPGIDATHDLLGVRFHDDLGPLLDRLGAEFEPPAVDPRTCQMPPLAREDREFVDTRGGRGWGNRCFAHIQAQRWTDAEAACRHGLEQADDPAVRGALLYNLGRVAEGREAYEYAIELYRESLELRPGNATVQARLDELVDD
jgi:hypothetical protein